MQSRESLAREDEGRLSKGHGRPHRETPRQSKEIDPRWIDFAAIRGSSLTLEEEEDRERQGRGTVLCLAVYVSVNILFLLNKKMNKTVD